MIQVVLSVLPSTSCITFINPKFSPTSKARKRGIKGKKGRTGEARQAGKGCAEGRSEAEKKKDDKKEEREVTSWQGCEANRS
jgi:hypothetical protein